MKRFYPVLSLVFILTISAPLFAQNNNVGIGTTAPAPSAVLDVTSTTQGMLVPRMTTAQRTGIAAPAQGLLVYDVNLGCFYYYNSTTWISLCQAGPAGPTGAAGTPGPSGAPGVTGPSGADGAPGLTGPSGADGAPGATGLAGPSGANGINGATGATGPVGPIGPGGTGSLGPTGANGAVGPTGPQGIPGVAGPSGANGTPGVTGPTGIAGTPGTPGATGPAGPTGAGAAINIQSVSLTANTTLNYTNTAFTNLSNLTLTFTPTQSKTFVMFTASGQGNDNNTPDLEYFRIVVNGTVVGGTTVVSSFTDGLGDVEYPFSAAFSMMVPVTAGQSNTVVVQYYSAVSGGAIDVVSDPNYEHATLTAFVQ